MRMSPPNLKPGPCIHQLIAYIADLELEVDRLRKQDQYLRRAFGDEIANVKNALRSTPLPNGASASLRIAMDGLISILEDLSDTPGNNSAHDEVDAIEVRPLVERLFRWQQRLSNSPHAVLHLELSTESINWFPVRLRHILDNLLSNALEFSDREKGESRVAVLLSHHAELLELRVTDNGVGLPTEGLEASAKYLHRLGYQSGPEKGVGLAVVKLLIEQCGGSLYAESEEGRGSQFVALLPRFDLGDYLTQ